MGKTYAMSGIMDWLKAASIRKTSIKKGGKDTKESIQEKIEAFKNEERNPGWIRRAKWQKLSNKKILGTLGSKGD